MIRFVWRSGPVTETPIWLPVNDGDFGGIPFAPLGRGTVSWAFSQGGTLGYHLSQIAWPLALAVPIAQLTSPLGWARQIAGPLALRIGRSIISAFYDAGTYGGVGAVGVSDRTINHLRGVAFSAPVGEAGGVMNRSSERSAVL